MAVFDISLAGQRIGIDSIYDYVFSLCRNYITTENHGDAPDFKVKISDEDIDREYYKLIQQVNAEKKSFQKFSRPYLESLAVYRKIAAEIVNYNTILFHGSGIAVDNSAFMFTAPSGTGKSTHAKLWRELFGKRAAMINDDKPLLKIYENNIIAYGSPWSGKHRLENNIAVPLKAVAFLQRGTRNHIRQVTPQEIYVNIIEQTFKPEDPQKIALILKLIDKMIQNTRFYIMTCNMEKEAAVVASSSMMQIF